MNTIHHLADNKTGNQEETMTHTNATAPTEDRVIWRMDLQTRLNVTSNTVLRWMKAGKLPPPDVDLSRKTKGWKLSTLNDAGIRLA